jgi:heme/copper-type cytochrome/quinol oxidase subunit 3
MRLLTCYLWYYNYSETHNIIRWKGCHLQSNIFIRLLSCYLCVTSLIVSVITYNLLVNNMWLWVNIMNMIVSLISKIDCNRDSIREYTSCYKILCYHMLSLLVVFISSEILLIQVYFWLSSNTTYSSSSLQVFQINQDIRTSQTQSQLTSTNTVILSFSGLSLGYTYHIRVTHIFYLLSNLLCYLLSNVFSSWVIKEYHDVNFYINDCRIISIFLLVLGLHYFHISVGIILVLTASEWEVTVDRGNDNFIIEGMRNQTQHHVLYSLQLVYWHFVELLWLLIYYVIYN